MYTCSVLNSAGQSNMESVNIQGKLKCAVKVVLTRNVPPRGVVFLNWPTTSVELYNLPCFYIRTESFIAQVYYFVESSIIFSPTQASVSLAMKARSCWVLACN